MVVTGLQPGANGEHTAPEVYSYGAKWPMLAVKLDPLYARRYARGQAYRRIPRIPYPLDQFSDLDCSCRQLFPANMGALEPSFSSRERKRKLSENVSLDY